MAREKERVARRIMAGGTKGSKLATGPGSSLFNQGKSLSECPGGWDAIPGGRDATPGARTDHS